MINILKKVLELDDELKKKIEFIFDFYNAGCDIKKNIRKNKSLTYVEIHRMIFNSYISFY